MFVSFIFMLISLINLHFIILIVGFDFITYSIIFMISVDLSIKIFVRLIFELYQLPELHLAAWILVLVELQQSLVVPPLLWRGRPLLLQRKVAEFLHHLLSVPAGHHAKEQGREGRGPHLTRRISYPTK